MFNGGALYCRLVRGCWGWDRKPYLGPVEIAIFSSRDFSRINKHDTFWVAVSTGYFYVLFLWAIAVSDCLLLGIFKNLVPPLSSITFTVNSHAVNHFYKYICFKYHTVWNYFFFIKIHVKVFNIQIWFKCKTPPLFFLTKAMVRKKNSLWKNFLL